MNLRYHRSQPFQPWWNVYRAKWNSGMCVLVIPQTAY